MTTLINIHLYCLWYSDHDLHYVNFEQYYTSYLLVVFFCYVTTLPWKTNLAFLVLLWKVSLEDSVCLAFPNNLSNTSSCPFNEKVYWQILTLFVTAWQKSIKDYILSTFQIICRLRFKHSNNNKMKLDTMIAISYHKWKYPPCYSYYYQWLLNCINTYFYILPILLSIWRIVQQGISHQLK